MPLHRLLHARFVSEPRLSWSIQSCGRPSATYDHSMSHENWPLGEVSGVSTQRISVQGGGDNVAAAAPKSHATSLRREKTHAYHVAEPLQWPAWSRTQIRERGRLPWGQARSRYPGLHVASNPRACRKELAPGGGALVRFPAWFFHRYWSRFSVEP